MPLLEAQASNAVKSVIDIDGSLVAVFTDTTQPVRLIAKYKPGETPTPTPSPPQLQPQPPLRRAWPTGLV